MYDHRSRCNPYVPICLAQVLMIVTFQLYAIAVVGPVKISVIQLGLPTLGPP